MKKLSLLIIVIAAALAVVACTSGSPEENSNQPPVNSNQAQQATQADTSIVVTEPAPGYKVEEKTFPTGEKIRRITRPDGSRQVIVYPQGDESPKPITITEPGTIERAMELTADETKEIITKAASATKEAGQAVGDKVEDAGQAVGAGAKRGAEEVKDAAGDAASATGKAVKKGGRAVKKLGEKIKN